MFKAAAAIIIALGLYGCCGFKMRGAVDVPAYLKTVCITPYEPYEPLQSAVRARLKAHNINVLAQPTADATVLELSRFTSNDEPLAFGSSGEVQRYRLNANVSYTLIVKSNPGFRLQRSITRSRELNRTNNMLLSNEGQDQIVKKELLNEVVNEILRQITTRPLAQQTNPSNSTSDDNPC